MKAPTASREELLEAIRELALRAEQYRWLLIRICPWPYPVIFAGENIPAGMDVRMQAELDLQPERRPPLKLTPEQGELEF